IWGANPNGFLTALLLRPRQRRRAVFAPAGGRELDAFGAWLLPGDGCPAKAAWSSPDPAVNRSTDARSARSCTARPPRGSGLGRRQLKTRRAGRPLRHNDDRVE